MKASLATLLAWTIGTAAAADMAPVEYSHMGEALLGFKMAPEEPKAAQIPAVIVIP